MYKSLRSKILLMIMVLVLVFPLFKSDGAYGAQAVEFVINNAINIQVYDQYGNKIEKGELVIYEYNDPAVLQLDLSTGKTSYVKGDIREMEEEDNFSPRFFEKYVTEGTFIDASVVGSNLDGVRLSTIPTTVRLWYKPTTVDYTLEANRVGLYVDAAWKNAVETSIEIGSETVVIKNSVGLTGYNAPAGEYDKLIHIGSSSGGSYPTLTSSSTKTEYVKRRIKLSDINSEYFTSDGYFLYEGKKVKIGSNNYSNFAMLAFVSGGMVTVPIPDSEGYVEIYVEKSTGRVKGEAKYMCDGTQGTLSMAFSGYFHKDMDFRLKEVPADGYSFMGVEAGNYYADLNMYDKTYSDISAQFIWIRNTDSIQNIKLVVHKHEKLGGWLSSTKNHWRKWDCGEVVDYGVHTFGSWIVDQEATEDATGKKHRSCTVCNFKEIITTSKLHKHIYATEWSVSEEGHWQECSCGDKQNYSAHASSKEATETEAKKCDKCGYILEAATGHVKHTEDKSRLFNNESSHWYGCKGCTKKMSESSHTYKWVVDWEATEDSVGQKHEECKECGYKKAAVEIPKVVVETEEQTSGLINEEEEVTTNDIPEEDTQLSTEPSASEEDKTVESNEELDSETISISSAEETSVEIGEGNKKNNGKSNALKYVGIVLGIVSVVGLIVFIVLFLKKKKGQEPQGVDEN